jgi:thiamine transport system permease protein
LVVPLVQAVLATPLVVRQVAAAYGVVPRELAEAAANAGADIWQTWRFIEAPLIASAIRNAAAFSMLVSLGEFGAASLLSYGEQATLPVVLYRLISRPGDQNYSMALAAAALLILLVFTVVALTSSRGRRR